MFRRITSSIGRIAVELQSNRSRNAYVVGKQSGVDALTPSRQPCQDISLNAYTDDTFLTRSISVRLIVVFNGADIVKKFIQHTKFPKYHHKLKTVQRYVLQCKRTTSNK